MFCFKVTTPKYYWSLVKTMLTDKKIPTVLPIIHDNKFEILVKKQIIVNSFLTKQGSIFEKDSVLPPSRNLIIKFTKDNIERTICKFDLN